MLENNIFYRNKVARVITLIIALIVTAVTVFFLVRGITNSNRLIKECDAKTIGVVYTYPSSVRSSGFFTSFGARYSVNDVTFHARGDDGTTHQYGDTVQIHYMSTNPSVSYAGTRPARMNSFFAVLIIFCGVMTAYGMIRLFFVERRT